MLMRNLFKCNFVNDGSRTLVESILIPEVAKAILDWQTEVPNLARFKLQDRTDISELLKLGDVDLSSFPLNQNQKANLQIALSEQED